MIINFSNYSSQIEKLKREKIVNAHRIAAPAFNLVGFPKNEKDFLYLKENQMLPTPTDELMAECYRMIKATLDNNGVGLSANQIGINKNFFVIAEEAENNVKSFHFYFHPTFSTTPESQITTHVEGCLSVPKYSFSVPRNDKICASWFEFEQNLSDSYELVFRTEMLSDLHARIFQHELDHLSGISIVDRTPSMNRKQKRDFFASMR